MHKLISKDKVLLASKMMSIGLMIVLLCGFLQATNSQPAKSQSHGTVEAKSLRILEEEDNQDCCMLSYYMYHMSVFLLGAFINVKGFIKVGVF